MNIIRFQTSAGPQFGILEGEAVYRAEGTYATGFRREEAVGELSQLSLLCPCQVTKIVAVGRNYAAHAAEHGDEVPSQPLIFLKPPSAVIGPGEPIACPPQSTQVEHEAELAVVIGRRARRVVAADAWDYVLGYTCANDVTARDLQRSDGQWSRAKGFDTFAPLGPWIVTELDPTDLKVVCRGQRAGDAAGLHGRYGFQDTAARRVHHSGDDSGAGGCHPHRNPGGCKPHKAGRRSRSGDCGRRCPAQSGGK